MNSRIETYIQESANNGMAGAANLLLGVLEFRDTEELWIYIILALSIYILYINKCYIRILFAVFQMDGPPAASLLGNISYYSKIDLLQLFSKEAFDKYGRIYRIWVSFLPHFVILEPDDIRTVLSNSKHMQKIYLYNLLIPNVGNGLITQDVEIWKTHRKLLQPAFHTYFLEKFITSFVSAAECLAKKFERDCGQEVNLTRYLNDTVFEILLETILGPNTNVSARAKDDTEVKTFHEGCISTHYKLTHPWLFIEWLYKITRAGKKEKDRVAAMFAACRSIIAEKRQNRRSKPINNDVTSLMEFMLDVNEKYPDIFTDEDIANHCCTFMVGGHESTSATTAITLFLLANHPEWQEKCVDEMYEIFKDDSKAPSLQDLRKMRCLDMCIKETLRLYPSIPIFARTLEEDINIGDHVVPKGASVVFGPYATHRLPHHFPDPLKFRPERFEYENSKNRHPYAFLPFSHGARNCIGSKFAMLEIKVLISTVLRRFQLSPIAGKTEIVPKYRLPSLRARGGLWIKITDQRII